MKEKVLEYQGRLNTSRCHPSRLFESRFSTDIHSDDIFLQEHVKPSVVNVEGFDFDCEEPLIKQILQEITLLEILIDDNSFSQYEDDGIGRSPSPMAGSDRESYPLQWKSTIRDFQCRAGRLRRSCCTSIFCSQ